MILHNFENVERSCFVLSLVCISERGSSYEYSADRMLENHLLLELISKNRVLQLVNLKQHSEKGHNIFNNFLYFKIFRMLFHSHDFFFPPAPPDKNAIEIYRRQTIGPRPVNGPVELTSYLSSLMMRFL